MLPRALRQCWGLVLGVALSVTACSLVAPKYQKPVLSLVSIQMVGGNFMQQNFLVKLHIQNPNSRVLPVTSLHVEMHVGGEEIATGINTAPFVVPAHGDNDFDMTIKANMALALLKLAGRKDPHSDSIDYDMTGGASIDLPFLRDLAFHQSGTFSLGSQITH